MPREEWRTKVLPHNFQASWNQPEALAILIHSALSDGFVSDCLEPARQLHRIDPQPRRGATYLAATLVRLERFTEAEQVVVDALRQHEEDGLLLTHLAKAQSGQGQDAQAERTLWHALELEPNLDNALLWYEAIHRERGGEHAGLDAVRRVATLPASWRAQLWIARAALKARKLEEALDLYRGCLARVGTPAPADLLQQVSGDLGNAGHLPEILQLVAPRFDAEAHGLMVGNNLIKAYCDLGQLDAAGAILERLYRQNRGDWKEHLSYWDTEIAKARVSLMEAPKQLPPVVMLTIAGPVWLKPESPAAELFAAKLADSPTVALLGSAVEVITNSQRSQHRLSDPAGSMSRALPLFLAEQLEFRSNARVQTLVPWVTGGFPGFVLSGAAWSDADAAVYARQTATPSDYVIVAFLRPNAEPWTVELRLVRTVDGKCLGEATGCFPSARPEAGLPALTDKILALLREQAEVEGGWPPPQYQIPGPSGFASYLVRLEQLLAIRCSSMDGVPTGFLSGEREILDGMMELCLEFPKVVGVRLLIVQSLLALNRVRPAVVAEYRERVTRLQAKKPLSEPAHGVVQRLLQRVFEA